MTRIIFASLMVASMLSVTANTPLTAGEQQLRSRGQKQGIGLLLPAINPGRVPPDSKSAAAGSRPLSINRRAHQGRKLGKIRDGTSNTFMFGE